MPEQKAKTKYVQVPRTNWGHIIAALAIGIIIGIGVINLSASFRVSEGGQVLRAATILGLREASANIVAVTGEEGGAGVLGTANIELQEGRGRVFVNVNPFVEPDTQQSVEFAKQAAEKLTGVSLQNYDIIVSFDMNVNGQQTQLIGGPSAGVALAVAIAGVIEGRPVRTDVAMTGTIDEDGNVGTVGGILEKAEAAGIAGMKFFLVPPGGVNLVYYERQITREQVGRFAIQRISYVPKRLSLNEHTQQWNLTSVEVSTLEDAVQYALAKQTVERLV